MSGPVKNTISLSAWRNGALPCPAFSAAYAGAHAVLVRTGELGDMAKLRGGERMDARFQAGPDGFGRFGGGLRLRGLMQQVSRDEQGRSVFATDLAEDIEPTAPATTHVNVPSPEGDESGPHPWWRRPV
ncbi:hypothetical protein [Actinomadura gamaensis]|uniref:Uncharacterized protein n=1 Tax=Actinomadura gamaensis TaxID=1763541 RepID=A0ABV9TST6_9ACTN